MSIDRSTGGATVCTHRKRSTTSTSFNGAYDGNVDYDLSDGSLSDEHELGSRRTSKRRRSGESPLSGIATRFGSRFPSFSSRWSNGRNHHASHSSQPQNSPITPAPSRSSSLSGHALAGSLNRHIELPPTPTQSIHEEEEDGDAMETDELLSKPGDDELASDPIDRKALASTPLLPPVLASLRTSEDAPLQSPLQSPTIAEPNSPLTMASPAATPYVGGIPSPPLSSKPSVSSFHRSPTCAMTSSTEIPPFLIADPDDEWAIKLGHANFTIHPEPYPPPATCDRDVCRQLFEDWELARCNFTKHQVRTGEHFGVTSNVYRLTEQKWAQIDARWKRNNDLALARVAAATGESVASQTPAEPAPVVRMPSLTDPEAGGKFPGLGDEDIVGPMVQIASQIQPRPSKKSAFLRFLSDIKFPGSFLGRSPTAAGVSR